jgi:hypothetical protein
VLQLLASVEGLHPKSESAFVRTGAPGWAEVVLASADTHGNYAADDARCPSMINLVEVICAERGRQSGLQLAEYIAKELGWTVESDSDEKA